MMLPERRRGRRWAAPRSRAGKLAVFTVAAAAMGYICGRLIVLLSDVRPYTGWYWLLAVAGGIVIAVAAPWALVRGLRRWARWPGWLLIGYTVALVGGMRYYLLVRFTPPSSVPAVRLPPPPWLVLEIAGLSAVTLTIAAITLLILAAMAELIAPGPVGGWLRARRMRRPGAAGAEEPGRPADRV